MSLRRIPIDGNYHLDLRVPDPTRPGAKRRVIRSLGTDNRDEAQVRYHRLAAELTAGIQQSPSMTVGQLRDRVVAHVKMSLSIGSLKNYVAAFRSFEKTVRLDTPLKRVNRLIIDSWRLTASQEMETASLNQYAAKLKAAFNRAKEWDLIESNPFDRLSPLREPGKNEIRYFHDGEITAIFSELGKQRHGALYLPAAQISLYAGLRVSEVMALRIEHIQGDTLRVEMSTKTRKHRLVPLRGPAQAAAQLRLDRATGPYLFPSNLHPKEHMAAHSAQGVFKLACDEVGVTGTWHMLRHTFSARLLSAGVPILTVSRWLGHASVTMTERYYGHLVPGTQDHLIEHAFK